MVGLESLFDLQSMDPAYRDALMTQMGLAQSSRQGMNSLLSQIAQSAAGAQQGAQAAESEYASALRQPPPMEGPGEVTRSIFGNIASAVSGQPQFAQQAQAANVRDLNSMMEQRKEQLARLHENVVRRADAAEKLGNLKLSTSLHMQAGQLERSLANIDKLTMDQIKQKGDEKVQGMKDVAAMDREKEQTSRAIRVAEIMAAARGSRSTAQIQLARTQLQGAEAALGKLEDLMTKIPAGEGGLEAFGAGVKAKGAAMFQPKGYPEPRVYQDERKSFRALIARTLGHTGVLTAQDVLDAMAIMPSFWDSAEVRAKKFEDVRSLLEQKYQIWVSGASVSTTGPADTRQMFGY